MAEDPRAVGDALGAVVVAADHEHFGPFRQAVQGHQEVVEQGESFRRRVRAVEDVPGDEDAVRLQLLGSREDLPEQEAPLLLEHRKGRNALSQMQICQMDEFHFRFDYFMFCSAGGRFRYSTTPRAGWRPRRCRL